MQIKLTIDMYSGIENPTLVLEGSDATKILDQIKSTSKVKTKLSKTSQAPSTLGYRGVTIEQMDKNLIKELPQLFTVAPEGIYSNEGFKPLEDTEFEKQIFDRLKKFKDLPDPKNFDKQLKIEIDRFRTERPEFLKIKPERLPFRPFDKCNCAPPNDIEWWNNDLSIRQNNNCYNYASNYRSDSFAQPGRAANAQYTSLAGCAVSAGQRSAKDGAIADCLINSPTADNKCPSTGHLVALVIWPGVDFHWYRKGPDGNWSHKPGSTAATLLDNAGQPITDPRTASRGPYTQFCTFMKVLHGHIKIK